MKKFIIANLYVFFFFTFHLKAGNASAASPIYDPNPNHLWNRLNETLVIRTGSDGKKYGLNEPDILYWIHTQNLLAEPSHSHAIAVLDEFINSHGENLIHDPLKRALLQHDLWELFDWSTLPWLNDPYVGQRKELQRRLAILIRRLALTTNEIAGLPDNYKQSELDHLPGLPSGLFEAGGDWVNLAAQPYGDLEIAPAHDHSFGACSAFLVMMRTPAGREATTNYLDILDTFDRVWVYVTNNFNQQNPQQLTFSPDLPQFPAGTQFALVRRMCVIDVDGNIRPTPLTMSIQERHYLAIAPPTFLVVSNRSRTVPPQKFSEFRMDRTRNAGLRAVADDERDFRLFDSKGFDAFEGARLNQGQQQHFDAGPTVLQDCATCHSALGIYSVNSYIRLFSPRFIYPPGLYPSDMDYSIRETIDWKKSQYNWGLLKGLWDQPN